MFAPIPLLSPFPLPMPIELPFVADRAVGAVGAAKLAGPELPTMFVAENPMAVTDEVAVGCSPMRVVICVVGNAIPPAAALDGAAMVSAHETSTSSCTDMAPPVLSLP